MDNKLENGYRNKPYCKNCDDRIQVGKAYEKKDIPSAWYVILKILDGKVHFKKLDIRSIPYEKDVEADVLLKMPKDQFKNEFEFVSTLFCIYEINPQIWESYKDGEFDWTLGN